MNRTSLAALDLNLALVLHTVLVERNVARAAAKLRVTPSAVSNALARLRALLGDPLVTRLGRGIVPTPRALELVPRLARTIADLEGIFASEPFDPSRTTRTFTLAVADAGQVTWVPAIAAALVVAMPSAHLRVVGIDALISLGNLGSSEVDLHLGLRAEGPGIHAEDLVNEHTVLVAREGHPVLAKKATARSLGELRHVHVDMLPGKGMRDRVAMTYARAVIPRVVTMTVPSFSAAAAVLARTDLVATFPASLVRARGKALGLRSVRGPVPEHTLAMAMCWHERTHGDPAARAFRDLVRKAVMRA
jgi:DNA-binding transcriptional LysR family regulator